jgi:molybdopterin molybdotransferase
VVRAALLAATREAHVVITSGGVSTGEADFVEEVLHTSGEVGFWRVSIKPGRPLAFGRIGRSLFFGLPGNPVAVMVTFYQFLQPALLKMMGETGRSTAPTLRARCESKLAKKRGRTEFYRAVLDRAPDGELVVRKSGKQGSGILRSMSEANCFVLLGDEDGDVEAGDLVEVQPFFGLI